jgi:hypothetical protein
MTGAELSMVCAISPEDDGDRAVQALLVGVLGFGLDTHQQTDLHRRSL